MKHLYVISLFLLVITLSFPSYSLLCWDNDPNKASVKDFVAENDVIFIGKRIKVIKGTGPSTFQVIEPLKGVPDKTKTIEVYETHHGIGGAPSIWRIEHPDVYLVYAQHKITKLEETVYALCANRPSPQSVIVYLRSDEFIKDQRRQFIKNLILYFFSTAILLTLTAVFFRLVKKKYIKTKDK